VLIICSTCDTVCAKLELQVLNVGRFSVGWFMFAALMCRFSVWLKGDDTTLLSPWRHSQKPVSNPISTNAETNTKKSQAEYVVLNVTNTVITVHQRGLLSLLTNK